MDARGIEQILGHLGRIQDLDQQIRADREKIHELEGRLNGALQAKGTVITRNIELRRYYMALHGDCQRLHDILLGLDENFEFPAMDEFHPGPDVVRVLLAAQATDFELVYEEAAPRPAPRAE